MNTIVEKKYIMSYKELGEKLGINEDIEFVVPHIRVGEATTSPESFGVEIHIKEKQVE